MKKSLTTEPETPVFSFYRPHARVTAPTTEIDYWTGEVKIPERRVKQSFVAECDINTIIKQFSVTGQITHMSANAKNGAYMDLPDDLDFQTSMNIIREGEAAFASLPSKVRERFHNNPEEFLGFMADPANQDEAIKLGLATKRPVIPVPGDSGDGTPPPKSTGDVKPAD